MKLPQLTLRDLFWLVALVAMGCGWWVDRSTLAMPFRRDIKLLEDAIEARGYYVERMSDGGLYLKAPPPVRKRAWSY